MVLSRSSSLALLTGVFAFALSSCCIAQESRAVQQHFTLAQQDQQQGLLDAAATEYQAVIRIQPGMPEAHINLGLVYYAQAKFEDSARSLAKANKLRPGMRGVSLWLGIDSVKLYRPANGAALLREAVRIDPADKLAPLWLGTALWNSGQINAALSQLNQAAARFPEDADLAFAVSEAYNKAANQQTEQLLEESAGSSISDLIYGNIYADEAEWTKAEGHLRRAIERDPKSLDARLKLAHVYLDQGHLDAMKQPLDESLKLAPESASALALEGELLLLTKQQALGLSQIKEALGIDGSEALDALGLPVNVGFSSRKVDTSLLPMCREAAQNLQTSPDANPAKQIAIAALYVLAGDENAAKLAYTKPGSALPPSKLSMNLLDKAKSAIHQHRYQDAETHLLRWLDAHPGDRRAGYYLDVVWRQMSMVHFAHLVSIAPDSYQVHQMMGELYASREEDDKALAEYLAVVAARPDLPGIHFWLGHLYWKHGDADHALAELTRELELSPGHPEASGELGAVLVAEDRPAEAIPHLESAIHSKPDLWPAYSQLGRAYATQKNYQRAEELLKPALAHDQDGSAHYQLGLVLRSQGKTAQATEAFEQVRKIKREKMATLSAEDDVEQGATK
jgi:tetratricopeptide (TPR) repeat protein